uniref:Ribosomal protein S9 n=1 Tax=Cryptomonas sp. CCAC 1634B TaxID=2051848 RepID=A0A679CAG4_9CRYP|nr:ribosomal protein S9 [Cryptomonas sp. CCAC 1634B]
MNLSSYFGVGHKKTSIARVTVKLGSGKLFLNGFDAKQYLQFNAVCFQTLMAPLNTLGLDGIYDVAAKVEGGGVVSQSKAVQLGLARALCSINTGYRIALKYEGFLTRISKVKERKKYGLKKARKAPQFSKR